ncbi:MAG: hypothetical protein HY727_14450 [Candidatus Rokubacteria bacterium]|nr:hypothetical protein [Candidatus Rokubacteria bacterium]
MRHVVAILVGLTLFGHSTMGWAESTSSGSTPQQVASGAGSVLATLVYSPIKASFCILGGVGAAFTAIVSTDTASKVVGASCRGTWVITPDALKGREHVRFVGDVPAPDGARRPGPAGGGA